MLDRDTRKRAVIVVSIAGAVLLCVFIVVNYWRGTRMLIAADALLMAAMLGNVAFLRISGRVEMSAAVLAILMAGFFVFLAYSIGGLALFWFLILPPGYFILLGIRRGVLTSVAVLVVVIVCLVLEWVPVDRYGLPDFLAAYLASGALGFISAYFAENNRVRLEALSLVDPLTGALNRRGFSAAAEAEILRARRYGRPISLLVLDLDYFKRVNDRHGHLVGDEVLKAFAALIRGNIRRSDILGRWGGEEFIILTAETPAERAILLGEKLRRTVEMTPLYHSCRVTLSVGVASVIKDDTLDASFLRADRAMYVAKHNGRNRVEAEQSAALSDT